MRKLSKIYIAVLAGLPITTFAASSGFVAYNSHNAPPSFNTSVAHGNSSSANNHNGNNSNNSLLNNTQASQDSCETIAESVGTSINERMKAVLPQNEKDNVSAAVENSQAVNVTNQNTSTTSLSISELFSNPFDYIKKAATNLYEAAKQKAQDFLKNAYANAIGAVTSYVNNMYAKQLSKISAKLGNIGGPLLTDSLGQFVPNVTSSLAGCSQTLSSECLSKITTAIGESASQAKERAINNANYTLDRVTTDTISGAANKVNERVNGAANKVNSVLQ